MTEYSDNPDVDLLVIGGGISGITLATTAAESGLAVAVVEISDRIGGSALLSEGYIWTTPSKEAFLRQDPNGDLDKFEKLLESLPESFTWLEKLGLYVGDPLTEVLGYGEGRQIDVAAYFHKARTMIERNGMILLNAEVKELIQEEDRVVGASFFDKSSGELSNIRAVATVIATGGFQSSKEMRNELLFPGADALTLRSNVESTGGGINLARKVGVDLTEPTHGFYGHLIPYPIKDFQPSEYALLAQYFSDYALIFNVNGQRFTDESLGDHINTNFVAKEGVALLFVDAQITKEQVCRAFIPGMDAVNKMAIAGERGANYFSSDSLQEIATKIESWGYNSKNFLESIDQYNASIKNDSQPQPPRSLHRQLLEEPPFAVLEIQAAITFTYRGLATDIDGRAISKGRAKLGLWVVGVDAGGLNQWGYTGGLVRGLSLGRRTGKIVAAELQRTGKE